MKRLFTLLSYCLVYLSLSTAASIPKETTITSCGDTVGWPPYTYIAPDNNVVGYDVDILNKILSKHQLKSETKMTAWKRCLKTANEGKEYHLVPSVSLNEERNKDFLFTRHYYTITPGYFFIKKRFPLGLGITKTEDLKNFNICGISGFNYSNFGIAQDDIDAGAKTFDQVVEKTIRGRCDVFLARIEIYASLAKMGTDHIKQYGLDYASVPGVESEKFYMMISRNYQYSEELKKILDEEIDYLESQDQLRPMVEKSIEDVGVHFSNL